MTFSITGLIYIYSGLVTALVAFLIFRIYQETKSEISHHLFVASFGASLGELLWGLPMVIFGPDSRLVAIGYLIAWIPVMFGLIYNFLGALEFNLVSRSKINIFTGLLLVAIFIFVIGHFFSPPLPYLDQYSLIHWQISFNYAIFSLILLGALVIYPGFAFLFGKVTESGKGVKIKKALLGLSFIFAAFGGEGIILFSNSLIDSSLLIFISSLIQFIGFSLLGILFLIFRKI